MGGLRADERDECRGRRLSLVGLGVAVLASVLVGGMFATQVERDRQQACAARLESRQERRSLGVAGPMPGLR